MGGGVDTLANGGLDWAPKSNTVTKPANSSNNEFIITVNDDASTTNNALWWRIRLLDGNGTAKTNQVVDNEVELDVTASQPTAAQLTNPGFQSGDLSGWSVQGGSIGSDAWTISHWGATANDGNTNSLVMQAIGQNNVLVVYQDYPVEPNQTYKVSGFFKPDHLTCNGQNNGAAIRADFVKTDNPNNDWAAGPGTWNAVIGFQAGGFNTPNPIIYHENDNITAPADAGFLRVRLMVKNCLSGKARFDELSVTQQ